MPRKILRDDQWERIKSLLPGKPSNCGVTAKDNRNFIEAVFWIARTGSPWRDLHEDFGLWHRVYVRYNRWCHKGTWETVFQALTSNSDFEYLMVDGSITRVHQHGAPKKINQNQEAVGKSRGGLTTKIHAAVDALGNPVRLLLTAVQASEYGQANALIEGFSADKAMIPMLLCKLLLTLELSLSFLPEKTEKSPEIMIRSCMKERNLVERLFQKLKHFRRVATRYEKLARNYMGMLHLASSMIWLA